MIPEGVRNHAADTGRTLSGKSKPELVRKDYAAKGRSRRTRDDKGRAYYQRGLDGGTRHSPYHAQSVCAACGAHPVFGG